METEIRNSDLARLVQRLSPERRFMEWVQNKIPSLQICNFTTDWNDGRAIGALVNAVSRSKFTLFYIFWLQVWLDGVICSSLRVKQRWTILWDFGPKLCSRSRSEVINHVQYAPVALFKCTLLQEHMCCMCLDFCAFKYAPGALGIMLQEHVWLRILLHIIYVRRTCSWSSCSWSII